MHTFQTIQHSAVNINLGAINRNCSVIRKHIGQQCQLCAVVKADGYGLGAVKVSSELSKHADLLAVYSADEAGELLVSGVSTPILVFAPVHTFDRFHPIYRGLSQGIVHLVVHGEDHMRALESIGSRYGITLNVQVKIDTGLHRGGCVLAEAKKLIDLAKKYNFDYVKFQKRDLDIVIPKQVQKIKRETPWGVLSYLDYKKKIEFGYREFTVINKYCKKKKN